MDLDTLRCAKMAKYRVKLTVVIFENDMQDAMKTAEHLKSKMESAINSDDISCARGVEIKSVSKVD